MPPLILRTECDHLHMTPSQSPDKLMLLTLLNGFLVQDGVAIGRGAIRLLLPDRLRVGGGAERVPHVCIQRKRIDGNKKDKCE